MLKKPQNGPFFESQGSKGIIKSPQLGFVIKSRIRPNTSNTKTLISKPKIRAENFKKLKEIVQNWRENQPFKLTSNNLDEINTMKKCMSNTRIPDLSKIHAKPLMFQIVNERFRKKQRLGFISRYLKSYEQQESRSKSSYPLCLPTKLNLINQTFKSVPITAKKAYKKQPPRPFSEVIFKALPETRVVNETTYKLHKIVSTCLKSSQEKS
ncbi:unnamed protein product [Moneuplotes crassus]|uniref:Uncharacterized protein n=1 Tax=Euplotes crassus TaxID=5936 RepID=A0AAD1XR13_EUPCR|nr:unnamed protein product [Moneuplotes crassus]